MPEEIDFDSEFGEEIEITKCILCGLVIVKEASVKLINGDYVCDTHV